MKVKMFCAAAVCLLATCSAFAQNDAAPPNFKLRGDRFKPLTWEELNPQQKTMVEHILAGPRGALSGPYNVLLRSPEMGDLAQQFGAAMRYRSSLPRKLNELAIIIVGRHWTAQYEWAVHKQAAIDNGLSKSICDDIAVGRRPVGMQPDEEIVYNFATELMDTKQVSDATFAAVKNKFGEQAVVDLVGVMGYYNLVSMLLNVDRYPLDPGTQPELKTLK